MTKNQSHGVVLHDSQRPTDYLYRLSLKCVITNDKSEVLVVKEDGREFWDFPGGGMDHGEDFRMAIARELQEEINFTGTFDYKVLTIEKPRFLERWNFWQVRVIIKVTPTKLTYSPGDDGDEVRFMPVDSFKDSELYYQQLIYTHLHNTDEG